MRVVVPFEYLAFVRLRRKALAVAARVIDSEEADVRVLSAAKAPVAVAVRRGDEDATEEFRHDGSTFLRRMRGGLRSHAAPSWQEPHGLTFARSEASSAPCIASGDPDLLSIVQSDRDARVETLTRRAATVAYVDDSFWVACGEPVFDVAYADGYTGGRGSLRIEPIDAARQGFPVPIQESDAAEALLKAMAAPDFDLPLPDFPAVFLPEALRHDAGSLLMLETRLASARLRRAGDTQLADALADAGESRALPRCAALLAQAVGLNEDERPSEAFRTRLWAARMLSKARATDDTTTAALSI